RPNTTTVVDQQVVYKTNPGKDPFRAWPHNERDLRLRQHSSQRTQRRHGHHRIADPVRAANYNSLDLTGLNLTHNYKSTRSPSSIPICGRQPNSSFTRVRSETYRNGTGAGSRASSSITGSISIILLTRSMIPRRLTAFNWPPPRL